MKIVIGLAAAAAMLATTGCGESRPTALEKAANNCLQSGSGWMEIQDEGKAIRLQQRGLGMEGLKNDEVDCVLKAVNAPEAVFTKLGNTTASGGEQTATWDGYDARWSFDLMDGTSITVTRN